MSRDDFLAEVNQIEKSFDEARQAGTYEISIMRMCRVIFRLLITYVRYKA